MLGATNFPFLAAFGTIQDAAVRAEALATADPRGACFYTRRALELLVGWLYDNDSDFKRPYEDHLASLLAAPPFKRHVPPQIAAKARVIKDLGNNAIHSRRPVRPYDAQTAVKELFHIAYWFARTYDRQFKHEGAKFDPGLIPPAAADQASTAQKTAEQLQKLEADLLARDRELAEERTRRLAESADLSAQLDAARREIAEARQRAGLIPDPHDYSEAQTRDYFIDLLLREAGWPGPGKDWINGENIEVEVDGMPNEGGKGYVDYVLWGEDGRPLALVEAKRTKRDARIGQQQAKLYADCLERRHGRRPVIYYTNGYETWLWDDVLYPSRSVQGFATKDELELMIERRTSRQPPGRASVNPAIVERPYQVEAIREISNHLSGGHRKGLIVMATGAGKTRTVIALVDLLMRCGWVKRALFLADRTALVNQAVGAFKRHLPDVSPVNLVTDKHSVGRVYVSTYPTMLNLIEEARTGGDERRLGVGHFDLVIIDEAHRSVYQKYRAIFEYFDSLLVGLTATPRDEVDRDTYGLFDLQPGLPTYAYELDRAVKDGYLVPPRAVSVPLKFMREGLRYDEMSEEDKERWDALEWTEDGDVPDRVEAEAVNKWLFNRDTVDKVLAQLMHEGLKVAGGDRLGKTIIFAKNKDHARFVEERFNTNYPGLRGSFARVIDHYEPYAQSLLDDFSIAEKSPHIAISVDMLDTGIDIPEAVNLVFFKLVRSKTKFFQMLGRGTRLCKDLFGPGRDKEYFCVFDYCQNFEFFNQNPAGVERNAPKSLGALIFLHRLDLHHDLGTDGVSHESAGRGGELRTEIADVLHQHVAAMNIQNFLVRPRRRIVERFAHRDAWDKLTDEDYAHAGDELAALPTELPPEDETAKRFDLLVLRLQLAVLNHEPTFDRLRNQVREITARLAEKKDIPMVNERMPLILEIQTDEWWQDATLPMLEVVRKRLRDLVKFIDKGERRIVYTDFEDQIGAGQSVTIAGLQTAVDVATYRKKMERFLKDHENHIVLCKLRTNEALTQIDLDELERLLFQTADLGTREDFERAYGRHDSLGVFIRGLVGLDRQAAKQAFGDYLTDSRFSAEQIRFVDLIINDLTQNGIMQPERLYEPPYTDLHPSGVDGLFDDSDAGRIVQIVTGIRENAEIRRSA